MVRPKKAKAERKGFTFRFRVTDEMHAAFVKAAEIDGVDTSAFVRRAAILRARELGVKI
jgi:uncharacterized protein (DUF1778 family)